MEDERLTAVETAKQNALNQSNNFYNQALNDNQNLYNQQTNSLNQWETTQNEILDKQLANQTQKIEQQKEEARNNTKTETNKALNDYSAYVNPYGYQAERIADNGLGNSGVSETSKLGAYTTYQNRVATANKALQAAITSYDNDINDAILNNDVAKAQNALSKLEKQLQYTESYYTNKTNLGSQQLSNNQNLDSDYYNRYQNVISQINYENEQKTAAEQWAAEMAEKQRQYNESLAFEKAQAAQEQANWEKQYNATYSSSSSGSSSSKSSSKSGSSSSSSYAAAGVIKNPYTGTYNKDALNGTFSNGYQPNNVNGSKLSKTGYKVSHYWGNGAFGSTGENLANQNIWTAGGKYYVWDGSLNDYIDVTDSVSWAKNGGVGPMSWTY